MRALIVFYSLVALAVAASPVASADPIACVGDDGPLAFCASADDIADPNLPIYCLHGGGMRFCPPNWD